MRKARSESDQKLREMEGSSLAEKMSSAGRKSVTRNVAILSGDRVVTAYCNTAEDLQLEQVLNKQTIALLDFLKSESHQIGFWIYF